MNLIEHILSMPDGENELLTEAFSGDQFGQEENEPDQAVEFEDIKKYILFGKLKELKTKLNYIGLNTKDPNAQNILEFLDLIILFYHTFSYVDAQRLVDTLIQRSSELLNVKVPERVEFDSPKEDIPVPTQNEAPPKPNSSVPNQPVVQGQ